MSHREDRSFRRAPDGGRGRAAPSRSADTDDEGESSSRAFRPLLRAGSERFAREAANRPILMFEDVYKSYRPGAPVLRGMNLIIEQGIDATLRVGQAVTADWKFD